MGTVYGNRLRRNSGGLRKARNVRLIPSPHSILRAAENAADLLRGRTADVTPEPSEVIDEGPQCTVSRYATLGDAGPPILLVPPLAAPAFVFDMRRGGSFVEYLVGAGRAPYVVDYGAISFDERHLGLEHWVRSVLPRAIHAVSEDRGGEPVHLVGWCLGGTLSALAAADDRSLPIASITLVATPLDSTRVPLIAPLRPIVELTRGAIGTAAYRTLGTAPGPLVKRFYQAATFDKYITKPLAIIQNIDDREYLAQIEAVDRFMDGMIAYPGRVVGQLYHDLIRANTLADGTITLEDREIDLRALNDLPILSIAGEDDGIAPIKAVHHIKDFLPDAETATAPGGHLGVLTGRAAVESTWPMIDGFVRRSSRRAETPKAKAKAPAKARKRPAAKRQVKKSTKSAGA